MRAIASNCSFPLNLEVCNYWANDLLYLNNLKVDTTDSLSAVAGHVCVSYRGCLICWGGYCYDEREIHYRVFLSSTINNLAIYSVNCRKQIRFTYSHICFAVLRIIFGILFTKIFLLCLNFKVKNSMRIGFTITPKFRGHRKCSSRSTLHFRWLPFR
jgi:hypothetical protein